MKMMKRYSEIIGKMFFLILFSIICLTASPFLNAATLTVTINADSGDGTLRQAIADASDGDSIDFNLSAGNEIITIDSELAISGKSLTIDGSNTAGSETAVTVQVTDPGTSAWRVFNLEPGADKTVSISNVTIKGGDISGSSDNGGGIWVASGILNLANAKLSGSKAVLGGGIYNDGTTAITNSTVSECSAKGYEDFFGAGGDGKGGGVYNNSIATITSSTFSGCTANGGSGEPSGNGSGGGFFNNGTAAITNSTFSGCSASGGIADGGFGVDGIGSGGGIYNDTGTATIVNSTFSGGTASSYSGGIYNNGTAYLLNTIAINNTDSYEGGDIYNNADAYVYYSWYNRFGGYPVGDQLTAPNQIAAYSIGNLGALADNGGPTMTMAVSASAPAFGNGGFAYYNDTDGFYLQGNNSSYYKLAGYSSFVPSTPAAEKITADQRGITRPTPPSIGAYNVGGWTITASAEANGSISPSGDVLVPEGTDKTFTITVGEGYHVEDVLVDGSSVGATTSYKFAEVVKNHTIAASFSNTYTITVTDGENGSIDPNGTLTLLSRSDQTFAIAPDAGYHVEDVLIDGVSIGAATSYTFTNLSADHTVDASFEINTYTVNFDLAGKGTRTGGGALSQAVDHGSDATGPTVSANAGCSFTGWDRPFVNITGNLTVTALYDKYTITAYAGANGAISPSGTVTFNYGVDQAFTITADPGFKVSDVLVDNMSVGAVTGYTFTNVTREHTISANFAKISTVVISNGDTGAGTLRQAIADAVNGSIIEFKLPAGNETVTIASELAITDKSLTIDGSNTAGSGTAVTVKVTTPGSSGWRVFNLNPGSGKTVSISNMTINGGNVDGGGGIKLASGTLELSNSTVSGSKAGYGGGIYNPSGIAIITSCTISGNTVNFSIKGIGMNGNSLGGGIYNGGTVNITSSTISGNTASGSASGQQQNSNCFGGGIYNGGTATITSSTISGNTASSTGWGIGIHNRNRGGGIYNGGTATITSSTISGNTASGTCEGTDTSIENYGGGIYNLSGTAYVLNTIAVNNSAGNGADIFNNTGINLYAYYSWFKVTSGTISTQSNAPSQTTAWASGDLLALADNGGSTQTMATKGTMVKSDNKAVGNGTFAYNTADGYYFRAADGKYHKLSNYATSQNTEPSGKIIVDQRGMPRRSPATIGSFQQGNMVISSNNSGAGTLRQAIADASDGDTITFKLPAGSETITIGSEIDISAKGLTIDGSNTAGSGTALTVKVTVPGPGGTASRVFSLNPGSGKTVSINNMTIKGGDISKLFDYFAYGGGISLKSGTLDLANSTISGAKATEGGGIAVLYGAAATISNSTFSGNTAADTGGGIFNGGTATISNSTVSGNSAGSNGGGVFIYGTAAISNSTISRNTANSYGGGIYNSGANNGKVYLLNTNAIDNTVNSSGSGDIFNEGKAYAYYSWYNKTVGTITTQTDAPSQTTACALHDLDDLANYGGTTKTMPVNFAMEKSDSKAVGNGTVAYNTDNTAAGYYFLANDGKYHKLTDYATSTDTEPEGKIMADQRGVPLSSPAIIGSCEKGYMLSGGLGTSRQITFTVPAGTTKMIVTTGGGAGDCDLYICKPGDVPSTSAYYARSIRAGSGESITVFEPNPGEWNAIVYGTSGYADIILNATLYNDIPLAPVVFPATQGEAQITLRWEESLGATSYDIYRYTENITELAGNPVISNITSGLTVVDTSASSGTKYYYWVKARNASGSSDFSSSTQGWLTENAATALSGGKAVSGISMKAGTTKKYLITVPDNQALLEIKIYGGTGDCDLQVEKEGTVVYGNKTMNCETVQIQKPTGTYTISLYANTACSNMKLIATCYSAAPKAPASVAASKGAYPDAILVSWKASAGATSYLIYRDKTKNIPSDPIATTSDLSYMDPKDPKADLGTTFNYWVKASNLVSNLGGVSVPSTMVSGNISNVPAAPSAVTVSNGKYFDKVTVSWPKVAGATSFEIFRLSGDGGADAKTITGASAANPCVITAVGHGFENGNLVLINGITGSMGTLLNGKTFAVTVKDDDTFSVPVSTLAKTYVSGGIAAIPVIKDTVGYDSSKSTYTYIDIATVTDPNPAPSAPCYYWVKAVNGNGESALKMGSNAGSVNDTGPSSPTASQGKFAGKIRVTWKAVAGATDYEVTDETGTVINTVSALTYDFTVDDKISHSFKVRANLKSEETVVYQSEFSKLCAGFACSKAITSLAAPVVKASNGVYDYVMLTWTEVPLALKYNVYRKDNAADGWGDAIASDITSLTYNDDGASAGQKYYYCVESVNGALATKSTAVSGFAGVPVTGTVVGDTFSSLGLSGDVLYSQKFYEITIPAGTTRLVAKVEHVTGSCDIYAKIGRYPTTTDKNAKGIAIAKTADRILTVTNPVAGTWYILLYGTGIYSNADLSIDYYTSTDIVFTQVPANDQSVPFTATFKGQVLDRSGMGIPGLSIGVRDPVTGLETWLAKTDKSGYFTCPIAIKAEGEYTFDFFFTEIPDNTNSIGSWTVKTNKNPAGVFDSAGYLTGTSIDLSSSTSPSLAEMQSYMNVRRGFTDGPATTDSEEFWVKNTLGAASTDANITSTLKPGLYFLLYGTEGAAVGNGKEAKPGLTASPLLVHVSSDQMETIVQNMKDNQLVEERFADNLTNGGIGVIVLAALNNKDEDTDDIIGYDISLSSSEQLELLANLAGNIGETVSVSNLNLNDAKFGNFFTSLVYIKIDEDSRNIGVRLSTFSETVPAP